MWRQVARSKQLTSPDVVVLPTGDLLTAWRLTALDTSWAVDAQGRIFLGIWNGDTIVEGRANDDQLEQCQATGGISEF